MRIKVHHSYYDSAWNELTAQLRVRHLLGEHYETWTGSPAFWSNDTEMPLTRKRTRKLNREYRRRKAEWRAFRRGLEEWNAQVYEQGGDK